MAGGELARLTADPLVFSQHGYSAAHRRSRGEAFQEIRRPVFSLLEKGPLAESCTYLSYDSLRELGTKHLVHLFDTVLDEYSEEAD